MVTALLTARLGAGGPPVPRRVAAVMHRNAAALRSGPAYWLLLATGFLEPLLYLLSIGVGVGALVGDLTLADGRTMSYEEFVAPAMLAVSAMSGALAETTYSFFFKLKYLKTYDAVLATPVRPFEIAVGELAWSLLRSSLYTAVFLGFMVAFGLTEPGWAVAVFPATVLVGLAFGALGMTVSTLLRGWQDFDLMTVGVFSLFLFSGTFAPIQAYPAAVQVVIQLTPLYHSVELVRELATGHPSLGLLGHAAYLLALSAAGLLLASRRVERRLCE